MKRHIHTAFLLIHSISSSDCFAAPIKYSGVKPFSTISWIDLAVLGNDEFDSVNEIKTFLSYRLLVHDYARRSTPIDLVLLG